MKFLYNKENIWVVTGQRLFFILVLACFAYSSTFVFADVDTELKESVLLSFRMLTVEQKLEFLNALISGRSFSEVSHIPPEIKRVQRRRFQDRVFREAAIDPYSSEVRLAGLNGLNSNFSSQNWLIMSELLDDPSTSVRRLALNSLNRTLIGKTYFESSDGRGHLPKNGIGFRRIPIEVFCKLIYRLNEVIDEVERGQILEILNHPHILDELISHFNVSEVKVDPARTLLQSLSQNRDISFANSLKMIQEGVRQPHKNGFQSQIEVLNLISRLYISPQKTEYSERLVDELSRTEAQSGDYIEYLNLMNYWSEPYFLALLSLSHKISDQPPVEEAKETLQKRWLKIGLVRAQQELKNVLRTEGKEDLVLLNGTGEENQLRFSENVHPQIWKIDYTVDSSQIGALESLIENNLIDIEVLEIIFSHRSSFRNYYRKTERFIESGKSSQDFDDMLLEALRLHNLEGEKLRDFIFDILDQEKFFRLSEWEHFFGQGVVGEWIEDFNNKWSLVRARRQMSRIKKFLTSVGGNVGLDYKSYSPTVCLKILKRK